MMREEALDALRTLLASGRPREVTIKGTSMEPLLKAGDRAQLTAVSPSQLGLGDLMAFVQGGNLIIHRFLGEVEQAGVPHLRQKGDNLRGCGLVPAEALLGRVVSVGMKDGEQPFLTGPRLWKNRAQGLLSWGVCALLDTLRSLRGRFLLGKA